MKGLKQELVVIRERPSLDALLKIWSQARCKALVKVQWLKSFLMHYGVQFQQHSFIFSYFYSRISS